LFAYTLSTCSVTAALLDVENYVTDFFLKNPGISVTDLYKK